ncbi:MAG: BCCT family transporter, partial [Pseudomonadales bacterium]|nr:BCCT family transporter [Pseudomonadales bacterium]NIX08665.1 BCCT family transporter [Pseudomonadales bacterium]
MQSADKAHAELDRPVFLTSASLLAAVIFLAALFPDTMDSLFSDVQSAIVAGASWYYVLVVAVILVSVLVFAFSSYGQIKLGPDHSEPDYSSVSWFAMMFAAGMGIGLMFFGVAEPVMHFLSPPKGDPGNVAAAREAMKLTFFHWGLHGWAIYAIVALILAYFSFRHGLPLTLRSALYPLIGERVYGPIGTAVDVFAIVSTTFGVATSLGLGVNQINAGLNYLFGLPVTQEIRVGLIVVTTAIATVSVVLGLDRGIKRLSEINIVLAVTLLIAVLAIGPTTLLLQAFMQNTGDYLADIVGKTFNLYAYDPTDWLGGWTIFYWGWWISWAPFVGLFIARISRGRTLREFVIGVLVAPVAFTFLWMTVFGNSAIDLIMNHGLTELGSAVQADESTALFRFFEQFPAARLLSFLAIFMVLVFFVTSADSGALVLNMLSSNGSDQTPASRRIFWMSAIGATALALLLVGGLSALQTAVIASALPFSIAVMAGIWGFSKALYVDHAKRVSHAAATVPPIIARPEISWQHRLAQVLRHPQDSEVRAFMRERVMPVM